MSEYITYKDILNKYRKFEDGEPVHNLRKLMGYDGFLETGSTLIIQDVCLCDDVEIKIKEQDTIDADSDIVFTCYHPETRRTFSAKCCDLEKATDDESLCIAADYKLKEKHKNIARRIMIGLLLLLELTLITILCIKLISDITGTKNEKPSGIYTLNNITEYT